MMSYIIFWMSIGSFGVMEALYGPPGRHAGAQGGFAAIDTALASVDRKDVRGIGISGQQHGFVPLDGEGQVHRHPCSTMLEFQEASSFLHGA